MKTLYESILSSNHSGVQFVKDELKNVSITKSKADLSEITFKQFIDHVDNNCMVKCLKQSFQDASKQWGMGRFTFVFKDGSLGIEIASTPAISSAHGNKWWREAFVKKEDITNPDIVSYNYLDQFHAVSDNGGSKFITHWGDRLKNIVGDYIEYLRKNYNIYIK